MEKDFPISGAFFESANANPSNAMVTQTNP